MAKINIETLNVGALKEAPVGTRITPFEWASYYGTLGMRVFPIRRGQKAPHTDKWQEYASCDQDTIYKMWHDEHDKELDSNIGFVPNESGWVVIDLDMKDGKNGIKLYSEMLKAAGIDGRDVLCAMSDTPSTGRHKFFRGECETNKKLIGKGIEVFGHTGMVLLPPSVIEIDGKPVPYKWARNLEDNLDVQYTALKGIFDKKAVPTPEDVSHFEPSGGTPPPLYDPTVPLPVTGTIFDLARTGVKPGNEPKDVTHVIVPKEPDNAWANTVWWLWQLDPKRADEYHTWLEVGFALYEFGEEGLVAWDNWSKQSSKYEPGACAAKWEGMKDKSEGEGITHRSLPFWVKEDKGEDFDLPIAPKHKKPSDYEHAMEIAGWEFRLNEADYDITFMGISLSGPLQSVLNTRLREFGYSSMAVAHDVMNKMAFFNSYHPIKDYLEALVWDGEDHIGKLTTYFTDVNDVFGKWLRYWLIGCVARLYEDEAKGTQNRMLVLDGKQDIGKSYFANWSTWDIPEAGFEGPINPEDKDNDIRLMRSWVWEVSELGSTVRKADRESLKAFISKQMVDVRKPYDKRPVRRQAISNFMGTINNESGFLEDPTGHRRFMVATLTDINWDYATDLKPGQIWAQAKALFEQGVPWRLSEEDRLLSEKICSEYERTDALEEYLIQYYDMDETREDWFTPTIEILEKLQRNNKIGKATDRGAQMRVSHILIKHNLSQSRQTVQGRQVRGYRGILDRGVADRGLI